MVVESEGYAALIEYFIENLGSFLHRVTKSALKLSTNSSMS